MVQISNCRETLLLWAHSAPAAARLGSLLLHQLHTDKVRGFPRSVQILQLNCSCENNQQDTHNTARQKHTSRASSRLCKRAHLNAFLWSILFKYLQIVYDINPFVLAILEVYLHSHWEFSPASPGQVKWRFSGNKQWHKHILMQHWYSFHLPHFHKAKDCFFSWQLKLSSGLLLTTERVQSQQWEFYGFGQLKTHFNFTQGDREERW